MTDEAKHDLEDHIELLEKLDKLRKESAVFRDEGLEALLGILKEDSESINNYPVLLRALFSNPGLFLKDSEKSKELKTCRDTFIAYCNQKLNLEEISKHDISIWYAANVLHTLVSISGGAHLKTTFYCYYLIIRDLYTADSAEWNIGGARANEEGQVTAYMTSERQLFISISGCS